MLKEEDQAKSKRMLGSAAGRAARSSGGALEMWNIMKPGS